MTTPKPRTLLDKLWDAHMVERGPDGVDVLYVDLHLVHEVTSPQAFAMLGSRGLRVRRPDRTVATADHAVPTAPRAMDAEDAQALEQVRTLGRNAGDHGIPFHGPGNERQGIVHVMGPELGFTHPGATVVCGDSHTSTHGAFGALAFGIGTTEVAHVLATQCLLQRRPKAFRVRLDGHLGAAVTAKDLALAFIRRVGVAGGQGHVLEYAGAAVDDLTMEGRMTLCNLSIEAGARAGLVAPDATTTRFLDGRPHAPPHATLERLERTWHSDPGAHFDHEVAIDADDVEPMVTYGTTPAMAVGVREPIPSADDAPSTDEREARRRALSYMGLEAGSPLLGQRLDAVFIGSCTNGRLEDLRAAAAGLRGQRVAQGLRVLVVPGSQAVKRAAEAEGLDAVFRAAGAQWRGPGCSMCIAMNGDRAEAGQYVMSTSNRNFEGRQGRGVRTILASPLTAAASALAGGVADPRAAGVV